MLPPAAERAYLDSGWLSADQVPEGLSQSDWSSIRAAYEEGRHSFQPIEGMHGHWQGLNPGQRWVTRFDGRGFVVTPCEGDWSWGLDLCSYGLGEKQTPVGTAARQVEQDGQRLSYEWDEIVQEWWVNDARGLEHGYIIARKPRNETEGSGKTQTRRQTSNTCSPNLLVSAPDCLCLLLATRGNLTPRISTDAQGVLFQDASGSTILNYTGLKVWDADGKALNSRFEAAGERQVRLVVEDGSARYPVTIDPIAQQAYLKASNTGSDDRFGYSVAVSGDTVVVGAYWEDSNATGVNGNGTDNSATFSGAAYVFVRSGTMWTQQAFLKASNTGAGDLFGQSVSVSGDTIVVGAPSEDSNATGINGDQANNATSSAGAAYVFVRNGTTWTQQAYLKASNTAAGVVGSGDGFGGSVAVSGDTVVVGATGEDSNSTVINSNQGNNSASNAGAAYVFVRNGTMWTQQAYLKASNTGAGDAFGGSVAVSGDTVVVGASQEDSNATGINGNQADDSAGNAGVAYVFTRGGTTWAQQAYLKASNTGPGDRFGGAVAVSGDTVVVGALYEASNATGVNGNELDNSATWSGAAYIFSRSGTIWTQQAYLKASNTGMDDWFGSSVAVSGDTVIVGALTEESNATGVNGDQTNNSAGDSGAVYIFVRSGMSWMQQAYVKASNSEANDQFGVSVAVSGDTVVIGAHGEDSNDTGVNGNQQINLSSYAGATYIFTPTLESWRQGYFGTTSNSGNAADSFDYDNDGLVNLLEWACHLVPTTSSVLPVSTERNGANLEFIYTRSVSALNGGTTYSVEWSDTLPGLEPWSTDGVVEEILSNNYTVQQVKATVPVGTGDQRFVRLKVTGPP